MPSHNCIIIFNVQFSRCTWASLKETHWNPLLRKLQSISLVVESTGIEPVTSCLQGRRSPSWAIGPFWLLHFSGTFLMYPLNWITHWVLKHFVLTLGRYKKRTYSPWSLLRKEVIQPHLPIRLPCYDFTPITGPTFGRAPLAVRLRTSGVPDSHGVTGGVYKARERIHRGLLIHDY